MLGLPTQAQMMVFNTETIFFLMVAYFTILYKSAEYIGVGSEQLLLLYGPGVVGSLVIPILGAVPDAAMVLFAGLGPCAQVTLNVGIGTLAGSTIMLITIPFGLCIILGYRDYDEELKMAATVPGTNKPKAENGLTLNKSLITTLPSQPTNAKIMMLTGLCYLFVFIPAIIYRGAKGEGSKEHYPVLGGLIACIIGFIGYSMFQYIDGARATLIAIKQQKTQMAKWKASIGNRLHGDTAAFDIIFKKIDKNGDGRLTANEILEGAKQMGLQHATRRQILELIDDMNTDDDGDPTISYDEFCNALAKWQFAEARNPGIAEAGDKLTVNSENIPLLEPSPQPEPNLGIGTTRRPSQMVRDLWDEERYAEESDDEDMLIELTDGQVTMQSIAYLLLGTFLTLIFSGPMVTAISTFSVKTKANPFFVSFFLTPIAGNVAEIYAALLFASKKTVEGVSLGVSSLYGAACMNNTLVLGVFCLLVFAQGLAWTFTMETIAILITIYSVGYFGLKTNLFVWEGLVIMGLFFFCVILIGALQTTVDGPPVIPAGCK